MNKYGLVKDTLPSSLEDKIFVFKDESGEIKETSIYYDESYVEYSGSSGELYDDIFEFQDGNSNPIKLKYTDSGTGSWSYDQEGPDYSQSNFSFIDIDRLTWSSALDDARNRGGRLAILDTPEKVSYASSLIPNRIFDGENKTPIATIGARRGYDFRDNYGLIWLNGYLLQQSNYSWTPGNPEGESYVAITNGGLLLDTSSTDLSNENHVGYILEMPNVDTLSEKRSGEFFFYDASLDLNNNGMSDGKEILENGHSYRENNNN